MGVLVVGLAAALFLQVAAPLDAFVAAWPVVAGALAAALVVQGSSLARALALAIGLLATAQVFYWAGLMFGLVGVGMPVILAAFTGLALMTLTPLAQSAAGARGAIPIALGLCVLGAALLGWTVST